METENQNKAHFTISAHVRNSLLLGIVVGVIYLIATKP